MGRRSSLSTSSGSRCDSREINIPYNNSSGGSSCGRSNIIECGICCGRSCGVSIPVVMVVVIIYRKWQ